MQCRIATSCNIAVQVFAVLDFGDAAAYANGDMESQSALVKRF